MIKYNLYQISNISLIEYKNYGEDRKKIKKSLWNLNKIYNLKYNKLHKEWRSKILKYQ